MIWWCLLVVHKLCRLHNSDKYSVELWARSAVLSVKLAELSELLALFVEWSVLVDFDHMKSNKRSSIQVYIGYVYNLLDKSADKLVDTAVLEHRIDTVTPPEDSYNTSELKVPRGRKCMTKSSRCIVFHVFSIRYCLAAKLFLCKYVFFFFFSWICK